MNFRFALLAAALLPFSAYAEDYTLTLKDHAFAPSELSVPADQKFQLTIKNLDTTPAEFESHALKREKVIAPGASVVIPLGPLKAGSYNFVEEYHEDVAKGTLTAK